MIQIAQADLFRICWQDEERRIIFLALSVGPMPLGHMFRESAISVVNGNQKCSDFGNLACSVFGNSPAVDYAAQDIVQKVFLNLYVRRSELREDIPIKIWLLKAVRFKALNWLKLHVNSRRERLSDAADPVSESSPYRDMGFNETNARISRAVASLPVKRRTVFLMSRIDNMSTEEIALATGLSPRTVEKHIELALKDLRRIIL